MEQGQAVWRFFLWRRKNILLGVFLKARHPERLPGVAHDRNRWLRPRLDARKYSRPEQDVAVQPPDANNAIAFTACGQDGGLRMKSQTSKIQDIRRFNEDGYRIAAIVTLEANRMVIRFRGEQETIGRETDTEKRIGMVLEDSYQSSGFDVPKADRVVMGTRSQGQPIRRECHARDWTGMSPEHQAGMPRGTSHRRSVLSNDADASVWPSGNQATS